MPIEGAWEATESALANLGEDSSISAGIAGLPALDYEEMVTSQGDFARGAIISLVLVTGLFMWAFHTLKRPALASLYSLAAVLALILVWSRSLRVTVLALFPLVVAIGLLLGIMRYAPTGTARRPLCPPVSG